MNAREEGFLLLTSRLGDPDRKVLSTAQLRLLAQCVRASSVADRSGELTAQDIMDMGYNRLSAQRIVDLLSQRELLRVYVDAGKQQGCYPITRVSDNYPTAVHKRLWLDAPGCLWAKGERSILQTPAVSLVGSRELFAANLEFAKEVGKQAALQGITLISGNARGADKAAQDACIAYGGKVISVVADSLCSHKAHPQVLYLAENSFDAAFTAQRAHSRNRVIHTLGVGVFVAQCSLGKGGTWHGTMENLRKGFSPVRVFRDGTEAVEQLIADGAIPAGIQQLQNIAALFCDSGNLLGL